MKIHCSCSILLLSALLGLAGIAVAADAPTGNVGFKSSKPTVVDLGPEIQRDDWVAIAPAGAHHRAWRAYRHAQP